MIINAYNVHKIAQNAMMNSIVYNVQNNIS